jgi:hypothetical protein
MISRALYALVDGNLRKKWSSLSSTSSNNIFSIVPKYVSSTITTMHKIGIINSIDITTSSPYVNLNGVFHVKLLLVVLYSHYNARIINSQSSRITLQTFVIACYNILLNASTVLFS